MPAISSARAVGLLETAIRDVLGTRFEDEILAIAENMPWYRPEMQVSQIFEYWVVDNLEGADGGSWVLDLIRPTERKYLLKNLGIPGEAIRGLNVNQYGARILRAVGLAVSALKSRSQWIEKWRIIAELAASGEDEKAASKCRQSAERLLRLLLYYYCAIGHSAVFHCVVSEASGLRIPKRLEKLAAGTAVAAEQELSVVLAEDGWADLGFLTIAARKMSARLSSAGVTTIAGRSLTLMTLKEQQILESLATTLQPYSHDRPSAHRTRRASLEESIGDVIGVLEAMVTRDLVPHQALVLEVCTGMLGPMFRARVGDGRDGMLLSAEPPNVGDRILFLANADRSYARCDWAPDAWVDAPE